MKKNVTRIRTFALPLILGFAPIGVFAQKVPLASLATGLPALNLFDLDIAKGPGRAGSLADLKWKELRGDFVACRNLAEKLQKSAKDLEPWVARTRLDCALRAAGDGKKEAAGVASAFAAIKPSWLREGPWKDSLRDLWVKAALDSTKADPKKPGNRQRLDVLLEQQDLLSRDQRAQALGQLGDTLRASDPEQAVFLLRESVDLRADAGFAAKIQEIERTKATLPKPPPTEALAFDPPDVESGAEAQADKDIAAALLQNHRTEAAKKMIEVLDRFPNGRFARRDKDRLPQLLYAAVDRGDESEANALRDAMLAADPSRLAEWAVALHRRGEDVGAYRLAEKALDSLSSAPIAATLLWVSGRAAEFTGRYDKARASFDKLSQFHAATDEAAEGLFRLALIELRTGNEVTSAKLFEKLITMNKSRWDLNARYWRVRALEKSDKERSEKERDEIIRQSPFTYYGLRLRAERDDGQLEFPKSDRSPLETAKPSTWFVGAQSKSWLRFKKLTAEGWLFEAQAELAALPAPMDPYAMIEWARALARAGQYPAAITIANKALDQDETLRHPRYLDFTFPRAYSRFIDAEAKKQNLDPVLVRSLIRQESAFGLKALSSSNAMGLMQLIPPTAREVLQELKMKATIPDDMFRPEVNVPMGSYYIAKMLKQFGNTVPLALAAYNAGPTKVNAWIRARPELESLRGKVFDSWRDEIWYDELPWSETSFYVKSILRNILIDRLIDQGRESVSTAFWSNLRPTPPVNADEGTKRR